MGWRYQIKTVSTSTEMPVNPGSDSNYVVWMGNSNTQTAYDSVAGGSTQASKVVFMMDIPANGGVCACIYVHHLSITFQNQSTAQSRYYDNGVVTPSAKRSPMVQNYNSSRQASKGLCNGLSPCYACAANLLSCFRPTGTCPSTCGVFGTPTSGVVQVTKGIPGNGGGGAWDEHDAKRTSSNWYLFWIYWNQMACLAPSSIGAYAASPGMSMTVF